jgi:uncharacterized damage-inducible protein DinB
MITYDLYLESGPQHKTTMCHLLADEMLGFNSNAKTTEQAVTEAPAEIRRFLRFLAKHGESVDPRAPFETRVAVHEDRGDSWYGRGSPYLAFEPDLQPVSERACLRFAQRLQWMREDVAEWVTTLSDDELDAEPAPRGRPIRKVVLHYLKIPGSYLSPSLGGTKGYSTIGTQAERGLISLADALLLISEKVREDLARATARQRQQVVHRPSGELRSLRKSIRRMLEHDWEHYAELARRPGGPEI